MVCLDGFPKSLTANSDFGAVLRASATDVDLSHSATEGENVRVVQLEATRAVG